MYLLEESWYRNHKSSDSEHKLRMLLFGLDGLPVDCCKCWRTWVKIQKWNEAYSGIMEANTSWSGYYIVQPAILGSSSYKPILCAWQRIVLKYERP